MVISVVMLYYIILFYDQLSVIFIVKNCYLFESASFENDFTIQSVD